MTAVLYGTAKLAISLFQLVVLISLGYHYLLLIGALRTKTFRPRSTAQASFAVVIPAHNEETVIAETVASVLAQTYPMHLLDIYVIADHCTDATAKTARAAGATVLERGQDPRGRKGYALKWGFEHILKGPKPYDALAIFDADSVLDPGCIAAFAPFIGERYPALQGQKTIRNAHDTPFTRLDDVNHRLADLLKNRAKTNLGFSARLMGDNMCFHADIIRSFGWPTESLVEDREFAMYLLLRGIRVTYVAGARSSGEAARHWRDATIQRLRWVGGGQGLVRAYAGKFLAALLRRPRPELLDQLLELVLPPYTVSLLISLALILSIVVVPGVQPLFGLAASVIVFLLWVAFPILGLVISGAPAASYSSLLYGPVYVVWRLFVTLRARLAPGTVEWVRTKRSSERQEHS